MTSSNPNFNLRGEWAVRSLKRFVEESREPRLQTAHVLYARMLGDEAPVEARMLGCLEMRHQ